MGGALLTATHLGHQRPRGFVQAVSLRAHADLYSVDSLTHVFFLFSRYLSRRSSGLEAGLAFHVIPFHVMAVTPFSSAPACFLFLFLRRWASEVIVTQQQP